MIDGAADAAGGASAPLASSSSTCECVVGADAGVGLSRASDRPDCVTDAAAAVVGERCHVIAQSAAATVPCGSGDSAVGRLTAHDTGVSADLDGDNGAERPLNRVPFTSSTSCHGDITGDTDLAPSAMTSPRSSPASASAAAATVFVPESSPTAASPHDDRAPSVPLVDHGAAASPVALPSYAAVAHCSLPQHTPTAAGDVSCHAPITVSERAASTPMPVPLSPRPVDDRGQQRAACAPLVVANVVRPLGLSMSASPVRIDVVRGSDAVVGGCGGGGSGGGTCGAEAKSFPFPVDMSSLAGQLCAHPGVRSLAPAPHTHPAL